jgi:integrative and conjugative element protein (TIGR02256 family)
MLRYRIGGSGQTLHFSADVLGHFDANRQRHCWSRESGGHLFATIEGNDLQVVLASGPERTDLRSRFSFGFSRARSQIIIDAQFADNRHYIGDWHTHPQDRPAPSTIDYRTMGSRFAKSSHGLKGMIFCIVGRLPFPEGLAVLLHNGTTCVELSPNSSDERMSKTSGNRPTESLETPKN